MLIFGFCPPSLPEIVIFFARGGIDPFRHRLRRCHTPPFVATRHLPPAGGSQPSRGRLFVVAAKFPVVPKGAPLGELANAVSLRGFVLRQASSPSQSSPIGLASSPKGRASGETASFAGKPETLPLCQGLSLWERWICKAKTERARTLPPAPRFRRKRRCKCRLPLRPLPWKCVWSAPQSLSGQSPSICLRRPLCRLKAPLGLSLLRKRGRSKREIINNSSAIDVQSAAEHILNRLALLYLSYLY